MNLEFIDYFTIEDIFTCRQVPLILNVCFPVCLFMCVFVTMICFVHLFLFHQRWYYFLFLACHIISNACCSLLLFLNVCLYGPCVWIKADICMYVNRPPDVVGVGLKFYPGYIFNRLSNFFFVSYPPSTLNGTQSNPATYSEVTRRCMSKFGISPPLESGPQTTFRRFSTTSKLYGKFNGEYLRSETRHGQSGTMLEIA